MRLLKTKNSKARNLFGQVPVDYLPIGARYQKHSPYSKLYAQKEGSLMWWQELNLELESCEYCVRDEDSFNVIAFRFIFQCDDQQLNSRRLQRNNVLRL